MHLSAGFSFRSGSVGETFRIAELDVVDLYGVRWPRLLDRYSSWATDDLGPCGRAYEFLREARMWLQKRSFMISQ